VKIVHIHRKDRTIVQVEHLGVRLEDYTFHNDRAAAVEKRLISLARSLAPIRANKK
jgi:hypothetical protein